MERGYDVLLEKPIAKSEAELKKFTNRVGRESARAYACAALYALFQHAQGDH
jgi:predicted dehydrogenase